MKKTQLLITALCASALLLGACNQPKKKKSSSVSSVTSSQQEKVLSSIAITTAPTKTSYYSGESFDPAGMVVTASYNDGSTSDVTSQCTFSPERLSGGVTSVTVSFGGKTASQAVTVIDWSAAEKALFAQYLHGFDEVPYYPVQGSTLSRDSANVSVTYGGGQSSAAILEKYASMFDSSWNLEKTPDDYIESYGLSYSGSKSFTVGGEQYTISVSFYGWDSVNKMPSVDGSGTFYLDLSDGFYYSWAEFKEAYDEALQYFYDDSWFPEEFEDAIDYIGELESIEVYEQETEEGELIFYVVDIYGISDTDMDAFFDAFDKSEKWVSYVDTVNNCPGFYHVSEKLCIGFMAYEGVLEFFIHTFYRFEWPADRVNPYIASINNVTTVTVPALTVADATYMVEGDESSLGVFALGDGDVEASVIESYKTQFGDAWVVEKIVTAPATEETAEEYYYSAQSKDHALLVEFGLQAYSDEPNVHYASVVIVARAPVSSTFPAEQAVAYYSEAEIDVELASIPAFTVAETTGGFSAFENEDGVVVSVFEATDDELQAFLDGFAAPWAVDTVNTDEEKGVYAFNYGDSLASCYVSDLRETAGYHYIEVSFEIRDWNKTQKDNFEEQLQGVIPPYIPQFYNLAWSADNGVFMGYLYEGNCKDEVEELLTGASWVLFDTEDESTAEQNPGVYYYYSIAAGDYGRAVAVIHAYHSDQYDEDVTSLVIYYEQTSWTAAQEAALKAKLQNVVPPYIGNFEDQPFEHDFEGTDLISESGVAEIIAVFATTEAVADGWQTTGEGAAAVITKTVTGGHIEVGFVSYLGLAYYYYIDFVADSAE